MTRLSSAVPRPARDLAVDGASPETSMATKSHVNAHERMSLESLVLPPWGLS